MSQTQVRRYSLLDPDLPLLAIDAAYEIEEFLTASETNASRRGNHTQLTFSADLINRLRQISTSNQTATADNELFCRSLLPQIKQENIQLPSEPISLSEKLCSVMKSFESDKSKEDLQSVRDFFITLSDFSLNTQRWSRGSSHP